MPVSAATLDASVIKLSASKAAFPTSAVDEGIAEWQRARGGVFSITMSQIIEIIDEQTSTTTETKEVWKIRNGWKADPSLPIEILPLSSRFAGACR